MDLADIPAHFIREVKAYSKRAHYERNAFRLSEELGIRIRPGEYASVIPGPPPTIILTPELLARKDSDHVRHEVAHVIMWWSGVEKALIQEYGCAEAARPFVEALCHAAIGFLRAPQNLVDEGIRRYGVSARCVDWLCRQTRMSERAALNRLIYDDPAATRAGFIMSGNYVRDIATCNFRLPFWVYDRVPEPWQVLPGEVNPSFRRLARRLTVGICTV
ncbi:hypothetical protein [Deinococcus sp. NW-56]|uniref:hypothetical protein n=1 Tax=Deinococcus sp. NW-56 TaxID=2080419 RepID=UPI000CF3A09A|nr:hypothetical protein [Deinococcus sp. NW-56]